MANSGTCYSGTRNDQESVWFFCFGWVCELKSLPPLLKARFWTPDYMEKTQLKVYLKNCSVYITSSLIIEKKVWHCHSLYSLREKNLNVAEFCGEFYGRMSVVIPVQMRHGA